MKKDIAINNVAYQNSNTTNEVPPCESPISSTSNAPSILGLYLDTWKQIANKLSPSNANTLEAILRLDPNTGSITLHAGYSVFYAKLFKMDACLPPALPLERFAEAYSESYLKVKTRQMEEIDYFRVHHPALVEKHLKSKVPDFEAVVPTEQISEILDEINAEIIKERIDKNSTNLNLQNARITRIPLVFIQNEEFKTFWENLTGLCCDGNNIQSLNLQALSSLRIFLCRNSRLQNLNLQGLKTLKIIRCKQNLIANLHLQGLTALEELNCSDNQLQTLNPQDLPVLRRLYCSNNKLPSLNLQGLTALEYIFCHNNQLQSLTLQGLIALKELFCAENRLQSLNLQDLAALQKLDCSFNQISSIHLQGATALQWLCCSNNQLRNLNLQGLTALNIFDCSSNQLTSLNLQELTALSLLHCFRNNLCELPEEAVTKFGLAWAKNVLEDQNPVPVETYAIDAANINRFLLSYNPLRESLTNKTNNTEVHAPEIANKPSAKKSPNSTKRQ